MAGGKPSKHSIACRDPNGRSLQMDFSENPSEVFLGGWWFRIATKPIQMLKQTRHIGQVL